MLAQVVDSPLEKVATTMPVSMSLSAATDLQDHLMVASNDLERLQGLIDDASQTLMAHFHGARRHIHQALCQAEAQAQPDASAIRDALQTLGGAITSLQFQDMATQLIAHTRQRLRNCADRLARDALCDDEDDVGVIAAVQMCPNPVTQGEMDAGSVELF